MISYWVHDTRKSTTKLCSTCSSLLTLLVFHVHPAASSRHFSHLTETWSWNIMASAFTAWKCLHYFILFFAIPPLCSLSKAWRGEELGQQPWACHCFTAFEWFSPLPHVCVVFPLSDSALPLCLPFAPPLFWSLIISLSTQSLLLCKSVRCPTLLCSVSFPVFPFICLWMLPVVYCVQLCNHYSQYQSL